MRCYNARMSKTAAAPPLLSQAHAALERHAVDEAQGILISLVVAESRNEEAWLLLARTFDDLERRMECMQRARQSNPNSAAIALAIQELKAQISNSAFGQPLPATETASISTPNENFSKSPASDADPELAQIFLDAAAILAQATIMTTEPLRTRVVGAELVRLLERAQQYDAILARRWASSAGRAALVKHEKALTQLLINMPQQDPQISYLREQRQRALDLFK